MPDHEISWRGGNRGVLVASSMVRTGRSKQKETFSLSNSLKLVRNGSYGFAAACASDSHFQRLLLTQPSTRSVGYFAAAVMLQRARSGQACCQVALPHCRPAALPPWPNTTNTRKKTRPQPHSYIILIKHVSHYSG